VGDASGLGGLDVGVGSGVDVGGTRVRVGRGGVGVEVGVGGTGVGVIVCVGTGVGGSEVEVAVGGTAVDMGLGSRSSLISFSSVTTCSTALVARAPTVPKELPICVLSCSNSRLSTSICMVCSDSKIIQQNIVLSTERRRIKRLREFKASCFRAYSSKPLADSRTVFLDILWDSPVQSWWLRNLTPTRGSPIDVVRYHLWKESHVIHVGPGVEPSVRVAPVLEANRDLSAAIVCEADLFG